MGLYGTALFASAFLVFSIVLPSPAEAAGKEISVTTGINIYVDDAPLEPTTDSNGNLVEAFIYNGRTYLPVRAVSEAVGEPISWEGATWSVFIGKHSSDRPEVWLKDLDYFSSNGKPFSTLVEAKDNLGTIYTNVLASSTTYSSGSWEEYYLNGNYSKIVGTIILNYYKRSTTRVSQLRLYADDEVVYSSPGITTGVFPVAFEVDLTGVLILRVEIVGSDSNDRLRLVNCGLYL